MEILKRRGRTRIKANSLYADIVADRQHTHMNSTKWETLSSFVQYLGKTGKAEVDLVAGKGWYIKYIDRDPIVIARQEAIAKREANDVGEEEKNRRRLAEQIEDAKRHEEESGLAPQVVEATELKREDGDKKVTLTFDTPSLSSSKKTKLTLEELASLKKTVADDDDDEVKILDPDEEDGDEKRNNKKKGKRKSRSRSPSTEKNDKKIRNSKSSSKSSSKSNGRSGSRDSRGSKGEKEEKGKGSNKKKGKTDTLALLMRENEEMKAKTKKRKDNWIRKGIVVKILNRGIGDGSYYKKKGDIIKVHDKFLAEVRTLDEGHIIKIDQAELETVIPAIGKEVIIVNGSYEGEKGELLKLNEESFSVNVRLESGLFRSKVVTIQLEDVCKLSN